MAEQRRPKINWMDVLWLVFLAGLAMLPPVLEWHKQLILLSFGVLQLIEGWFISRVPRRGAFEVVLLKIALATLLIDHTGELSINSSYWPIYILPVVTAAEYFGSWATLAWTVLASAAYCSYLAEALEEYDITTDGYLQLAIRVLFLFLAAVLVNRFVIEIRRQTKRYQELAETLAETNRRLEQAEADARRSERLAALGQLSAGLAHEIRNPLGVIKGSAEMLHQKLGDSNPLARELADYISSETNRVSALVTRFLNFARPLHAEPVLQDIRAVLDRSLNAVATIWQGGEIRVEKDYQANLPNVPIDEGLCEQAFVNIIQNAYDAMGDTGGELRLLAVRAHVGSGDGIEIRIEDSGPGIPPELREQIFNPFVTTKKTGVGLGLSIVSKIMDGHQGSIRIEQGQGKGAGFVLFFPLSAKAVPVQEPSQLVIS